MMKKYMKVLVAVATVFCSILFLPNKTSATTVIDVPTLNGATTWTKEASPYLIASLVYVPSGSSLTILPGTILKFDDGAGLTADGTLDAEGTENDPIYMTSAKNDALAGDTNGDGNSSTPSLNDSWQVSVNGVNSKIQHVAVSYASAGFSFSNPLNTQFSDITFDTIGGATSIIGGQLSADDISFKNVRAGLSILNGANVTLDNVDILGNNFTGQGVTIANASLAISHSTISGFDRGFSIIGQSSLTGGMNTIQGNAKGIAIDSGVHQVLATPKDLPKVSFSIEEATPPIHFSNNTIKDNVSVGVTNSTNIAADFTNNWWGNSSGPHSDSANATGTANAISSGVNFSPWLTHEPVGIPACCSNVLFLPGLEASRLYEQGAIFDNQSWEPNRPKDIEALYMNQFGSSTQSGIYTRDIIDSAEGIPLPSLDIYKDFISSMNQLVASAVISAWKPLPYDWRYSAEDTVNHGTIIGSGGVLQHQTYSIENMVQEAEAMAQNSKTGKVTIVAHSNGGLIAKALVQKLQSLKEDNLVDKVVLVATPELGTPEAVASLLHGYDTEIFGGLFLNRQAGRELAENMPSAYTLLPSQKYFDAVSDPVVIFDPSVSKKSNLLKNGTSISTSVALDNFLLALLDGRKKPPIDAVNQPNVLNSLLLTKANNEHANLDVYQFPAAVQVYQIAGWGLDTLKGIYYFTNEYNALDYEPIFTSDGDHTVVTPSASAIATVPTYYVNLAAYNSSVFVNRNHASILEVEPVRQLINNIIEGNNESPNLITMAKPVPNANKRLLLSVHSPVSLDVNDNQGNHTGVIEAATSSEFDRVEEQIPNSYYMDFGDAKYVGIDDGAADNVKMLGTGIGTFTFDVATMINGQVSTTSEWNDVPVLPTSQVSITVGEATTTSQLAVDLDGDGTTDFTVSSQNDVDPVDYLTAMKSVVTSLGLNKNIEKQTLKKIDDTIQLLKHDKIKRATIKVKNYIKTLTRVEKHVKRIDPSDADTILDMLNKLLASLS